MDAERESREGTGGSIGRRYFLKLAGGVAAGAASTALLYACGGGNAEEGAAGGTLEGRLLSRPDKSPPSNAAFIGLRPLGLGAERDGLFYVPPSYEASRPAPFALMLHGAGGDAQGGISPFLDLADEVGLVLLAPKSRGRTWDLLAGGYGPDVEFIDRALEQTLGRLAVDPERLAVGGFSDGASYALSLGIDNGDLFSHVLAFSPGFSAPAERRGMPPVFVSHGTADQSRCLRRVGGRVSRVHEAPFGGQ